MWTTYRGDFELLKHDSPFFYFMRELLERDLCTIL